MTEMGMQLSRFSMDHYRVSLDADGKLEQFTDAPGTHESADNVLRLEAHSWREQSPMFRLTIQTLVPQSDFEWELNASEDYIRFSFNVHAGYPGGHTELLRRTQRLFRRDGLLGITEMFLGNNAMADHLTELRAVHKKHKWQRPITCHGCQTSWLKRDNEADTAYFKFVVDKMETALLAVDKSDEQYRTAVGSKPEKFLQMLTIPVRIWMIVQLAHRQYNKRNEEFKARPGKLQQLWNRLLPMVAGEQPTDEHEAHHREVSSRKDPGEEEREEMQADVTGNQPAEQSKGPSKSTLKKKQQKKNRRARKEKEEQEAAANASVGDIISVSYYKPVALTSSFSYPSLGGIDVAQFDARPRSSSSPAQFSGSVMSCENSFLQLPVDLSFGSEQPAVEGHKTLTSSSVTDAKATVTSEPTADARQGDTNATEEREQYISMVAPANHSDSGGSQFAVNQSLQTVSTMGTRSSKKKRRKRIRMNQRKSSTGGKGLLETQEPAVQDDETHEGNVDAQDARVSNTQFQRKTQSTDSQPSPSKPATSEEPAKRDKGKARVSDIRTLDEAFSDLEMSQTSKSVDTVYHEDISSDVFTAATQQADSEFWLPVRRATNPKVGESSMMRRTRARTPSLQTVVAAGPSRGPSSSITTAKTPSFNAAVPVGPKQEDVSSSRTTTAMTPGPRTVVPARPSEEEFVHGADQAMKPSIQTEVAARPSQEGVPAIPASVIIDRRAQSSRAHAEASTGSTRASRETVVTKSVNFFYDLNYHTFECQMQGCSVRCMLWDGGSIICPACGPYSEGIYCSKEHMRDDVKSHWQVCGQFTFGYPCKVTSVPPDLLLGPPQIPSVHNWSSPEHHRQAMWFCTSRREGDYFVFPDLQLQKQAGVRIGDPYWRCSPHVLFTVNFTDEAEKDRFRRILAAALLASLEVQPMIYYLFRLIRDWFRSRGQWSEWMDEVLRYQFQFELGIPLFPDIIGQRHACELEWTGQTRRHCRDPICVSECPSMLVEFRGFQSLCDIMEANYWILRASRFTHPTIRDVRARTRGEGFVDVLEEDQRLFCRGEGWDGFNSGPMEIEESLAGVQYCPAYPL